jgi:hypothetical protein
MLAKSAVVPVVDAVDDKWEELTKRIHPGNYTVDGLDGELRS